MPSISGLSLLNLWTAPSQLHQTRAPEYWPGSVTAGILCAGPMISFMAGLIRTISLMERSMICIAMDCGFLLLWIIRCSNMLRRQLWHRWKIIFNPSSLKKRKADPMPPSRILPARRVCGFFTVQWGKPIVTGSWQPEELLGTPY